MDQTSRHTLRTKTASPWWQFPQAFNHELCFASAPFHLSLLPAIIIKASGRGGENEAVRRWVTCLPPKLANLRGGKPLSHASSWVEWRMNSFNSFVYFLFTFCPRQAVVNLTSSIGQSTLIDNGRAFVLWMVNYWKISVSVRLLKWIICSWFDYAMLFCNDRLCSLLWVIEYRG